jgi:hypothetical protein
VRSPASACPRGRLDRLGDGEQQIVGATTIKIDTVVAEGDVDAAVDLRDLDRAGVVQPVDRDRP